MSASVAILPPRRPAVPGTAGGGVQSTGNGVSVESMPSAPIYASAGEILGRRDLSDEAILAAVAERLAFEKRDPSQAKVVLSAALQGKQIAVNFVRSLALPMPQAPLEMPIQPLLAAKPEKPDGAGRRRRFAFFG